MISSPETTVMGGKELSLKTLKCPSFVTRKSFVG
jgi:hypothetical protein